MWLKYSIIAVLLVVAELVYFRIADHFNIVDKPNDRGSHKKFVLRGGGIIYLIGVWIYALFFGMEQWPFLLGLTMVAGISFVDDIHSLPISARLVVQFVVIALMFYTYGILNWESWWIVIPGLIICVGIINAYNFMDGINGITGGYSLAVLFPLAWLNYKMQFVDQNLIIVTIIADLVFCFFNYRPKGKAKCFAGDVGSIGVAFIIIFLLGKLIIQTGDSSYFVFLVVYGVDAVFTICHRIMLHENLCEAHRKHAYQLMANELKMEHTTVSSLYMAIQLVIAVGMILIPDTPLWHWSYFLVIFVVLAIAYLLFMKKYYHLHEEYLATLHR